MDLSFRSTFMLIGANSFVRKPLAFAEFAETVARPGVYRLATNEPPPAKVRHE